MLEISMLDVKPDLKKILVIGHEGVGKTNFIKTMPKPIYIFSFDKGYQTLAGEDKITVGVCMDEDRYKPHAYADFSTKFDQLQKGLKFKNTDGTEEPYKTIAIDSISFLSTFLYDHIQRLNNNIDKPGGYAAYGAVKSKLQDIINRAIIISEYVVVTALLTTSKDEDTGELFFVPNIVGSIKDEIGAWFDAVFYMTVDKNPTTGAKTYKMLTVGDRRQKAKLRLPSSLSKLVAASEEPDFSKLLEKLKPQPTQQPTK
jgi:hypothetical protein